MEQKHFSVLSLLSMILGIIGLITSWLPVAIIFNIIALVLGIIALARNQHSKGMAVAGVSTSAIGIAIFAIILSMQFINKDDSTNYDVSAVQEQQDLPEETNLTTLTNDEINDLYANGHSDSYTGKKITVTLEVYRDVEKHDDCVYVFCCTNKTDDVIYGSTCAYYKDPNFSCKIGDTVTINGIYMGISHPDGEEDGGYCMIDATSIEIVE